MRRGRPQRRSPDRRAREAIEPARARADLRPAAAAQQKSRARISLPILQHVSRGHLGYCRCWHCKCGRHARDDIATLTRAERRSSAGPDTAIGLGFRLHVGPENMKSAGVASAVLATAQLTLTAPGSARFLREIFGN